MGIAIFFGSRMCELRSFDRREGCFWKGRWKRGDGSLSIRRADLNARLEKEALKDYIDLADVYAIQLIKEYVRDLDFGNPGGWMARIQALITAMSSIWCSKTASG